MSSIDGFDFVADLVGSDYEWDAIGVWRNITTRKLFWGTDSGCSCYGPWESLGDGSDLAPLEYGEIAQAVRDIRDTTEGERADFLRVVNEALRA